MPLRRRLHRQLSVKAWDEPGLSPVNRLVVALILANLLLQVLATEPELRQRTGGLFTVLEWVFVSLFTVEYAGRLWTAGEEARYAGLVGRLRWAATLRALIDLLAILPAYLSLGAVDSSVLRTLRLLRVLRFARFGAFSAALDTLAEVIRERLHELTVGLVFMAGLLLAAATGMWVLEGDVQPQQFGSIPRALWWSVVTMTTVGYGDVTPQTPLGRALAGMVALLGVAVIAIPSGILAGSFSEVVQRRREKRRHRSRP